MKKQTVIRVIRLLDGLRESELSKMNKLDNQKIKIKGDIYNTPDEVIEAYGFGQISKAQKEKALSKFKRSNEAIEHEENIDLIYNLMVDLHQLVLKMEEENKDEI